MYPAQRGAAGQHNLRRFSIQVVRIIGPLAVLIAACSDGPSAVRQSKVHPGSAVQTEIAGPNAEQSVADVVAALNAAWVAKDPTAYAAPYAQDAEVITPVGTFLHGRAEIEARHIVLFAGPFAGSSSVLTIRRQQFLTGTIAMVDYDQILTTSGAGVQHLFGRWVLTKREGVWEIVGQQSIFVP